jgi:hypothetical protein
MNKTHDTIIVGGGIAGLACAQELTRLNKDFLMLTENIGGRIETSKKGQVNYGAYLIGPDCTNMLTCAKKVRRLHPFGTKLHNQKESYTLWRLFRHPLCLFKLLKITRKFRKEYKVFKKNCHQMTQKKAFELSPFLLGLYKQNAADFVKENQLNKVIDHLLDESVYLCTFVESKQLNAFDFMHILMHFDLPIYEFYFDSKKFTQPFKNKIKIKSVKSVKKGKIHQIKTAKKIYHAHNLVIATPISVSKKLLKLKKIKGPINSYCFHVKGDLKPKWAQSSLHLFDDHSDIIFISTQADKTHLIYAKTAKLDLKNYFKTHTIIAKKHWKPAFNLIGEQILDANQGSNIYMIGDYNVCGMEDSFITGVWAARQIT